LGASGVPSTTVLQGGATADQAARVDALQPLPHQPGVFVKRLILAVPGSLAVADDIAVPGGRVLVRVMTAVLSAPGDTTFTVTTTSETTGVASGACDVGCEVIYESAAHAAEVCGAEAELCPATAVVAGLGILVCYKICEPPPPLVNAQCTPASEIHAFQDPNYGAAALSYNTVTCNTAMDEIDIWTYFYDLGTGQQVPGDDYAGSCYRQAFCQMDSELLYGTVGHCYYSAMHYYATYYDQVGGLETRDGNADSRPNVVCFNASGPTLVTLPSLSLQK
jgi:hypothetical protein